MTSSVGARGPEAELVHRVQDAPVDGLQAVAHVGQRAPDDDRHRVVEIRSAHLVFERARLDVAAADYVQAMPSCSDVEVGDGARVFLDELATRLDLVAHQHREDAVGGGGILDRHLASVRDAGSIVVSAS